MAICEANGKSSTCTKQLLDEVDRVRTGPGKPGILLWHFPGLESPGKRSLVLERSGNLLTQIKYEVYGRQ